MRQQGILRSRGSHRLARRLHHLPAPPAPTNWHVPCIGRSALRDLQPVRLAQTLHQRLQLRCLIVRSQEPAGMHKQSFAIGPSFWLRLHLLHHCTDRFPAIHGVQDDACMQQQTSYRDCIHSSVRDSFQSTKDAFQQVQTLFKADRRSTRK